MRQFAEEGHLVLYASHRFHRGGAVRMHAVNTNILEVSLPGDPAANIFQMLPSESDCMRMTEALARLRAETGLVDAVVVAQHPYWTALSESLREHFAWPIVYDCMDDHSGFLHNGKEILETESRLIETSDLVVVSSAVLLEGLRRRAGPRFCSAMAASMSIFVQSATSRRAAGRRCGSDTTGRSPIGSTAGWSAELAGLRPAWQFELIGSTLAGDVRPLQDAANIRLLGERGYNELPRLIGEWDGFIIPFKRVGAYRCDQPGQGVRDARDGQARRGGRAARARPDRTRGADPPGPDGRRLRRRDRTAARERGSCIGKPAPGLRPPEHLADSARRSGSRDRPDSPPMCPGRGSRGRITERHVHEGLKAPARMDPKGWLAWGSMGSRRSSARSGPVPRRSRWHPVIRAFRSAPWARCRVLSTGQHRELVNSMLGSFGIEPDLDLDIMRPNQTLVELTARLLPAVHDAIAREQPAIVLGQGDTTTVLATAMASFYHKIPFGHVEAGLRTHRLYAPFPEEANRVLAGHLSALHFAPTASSRENLVREGIDADTILITGNTVIDALFMTAERDIPIGVELDATRRMVLVTAHRRDSFGEPIRRICRAIRELHDRFPDVEFLWPVHPNPSIKPVVEAAFADRPRVRLCEPLAYGPFVSALKRCHADPDRLGWSARGSPGTGEARPRPPRGERAARGHRLRGRPARRTRPARDRLAGKPLAQRRGGLPVHGPRG